MRVTMDEVNEVIKNYYEKMHPDFILTKRIVDNLEPIVYKGLIKTPDDMKIDQALSSVYSFLEKENILNFITTRQPCVLPISDEVIGSIESYFATMLPNMKICHIYRKSNHPDDQYLYMVTAAKDDGTYACWSSWNAVTESLNHGHYNLESEQAGITILNGLFNDISDEPEKYGMNTCEYAENQIQVDNEEQQKHVEAAQEAQNESDLLLVNRRRGR